jgi:hypothetical protein
MARNLQVVGHHGQVKLASLLTPFFDGPQIMVFAPFAY